MVTQLGTLFKLNWNSFHTQSKIYLTLMETSASEIVM